MSTTELVELINKLPAEKQKKVVDFIDSLIVADKNQKAEVPFIEIKAGFGGGKGLFGKMSDDFDEPLEEFKAYM